MDKLDKPRLLLKVGTATLTKGREKISRAKIEDIVVQVVELRERYDVILVCSGAIAAAKQFIQLEKLGVTLKEKQALAAIGQPFLMRLLQDSFRDYGLPVGQCLLSYGDFEHETSKTNILDTVTILLKNGILPVINENDTTATDEIKFGDNDKLSAYVSVLMEVDLFILATNTYGIYDNEGKTISLIESIADIHQYIQADFSEQGSGGMRSKLEAAQIAQDKGIETWIVNGHEDNFLRKVFGGESGFSRIGAGRG